MNEKKNDEIENNNSMAQQENVDKKLDQEKYKENKTITEEISQKNETTREENSCSPLL